MADKVLWKTGDTITADKLNGSGVFVMPGEYDAQDAITMPDVTAKQVVDALRAGAQLEIVIQGTSSGLEQWFFLPVSSVNYNSGASPATVTVVFAEAGENVTLIAEYPDGTFASGGGK